MNKLRLLLIIVIAAFSYTARCEDFTVGNFKYTVLNGNTVSVAANGDINGDVTVPSQVTNNGTTYTVTELADRGFTYCRATSVSLPNTITKIAYYAFYGSSINQISIPSSVTEIGTYCFGNCDNLTSITIPENVNTIASNPFIWCSKLKDINVAPGNKNYKSVDGMLLNSSGTELISYAIGRTNSHVSIPESVEHMDWYVFSYSNNIKSVSCPSTLRGIGMYAFYCCSSLEKISMPDSLSSIYTSAFYGCTSLKSIVIPQYAVRISDNVGL